MSRELIGALKRCALAACVALSGCATPLVDDQTEAIAGMPAPSTSNAEIASAIQDLIKTYPVCSPLRALRLVGRSAINFDPDASGARSGHLVVTFTHTADERCAG